MLHDGLGLEGLLRFYERPEGGSNWREVLQARNLVLDQFYADLLTLTLGPSTINFAVGALAIGTATAPVPARTDTGLTTEWVSGAGYVPQRMGVTSSLVNTPDPPYALYSFFLPASSNTSQLNITEAGLLYNNPSLTPGGAGKFMTHTVFSYSKGPAVDLRIDYQVQRSTAV